jgi:hypothetical protein
MHDLDEILGSSDGTPFVIWEVVGDRTVDEVITIGRAGDRSEALTKMQALSTKYAMGISIDQVQLKNMNPPKPVTVRRLVDASLIRYFSSWGRCNEALHVVNARGRLHRDWAIVHADWRR